MDKKKIIIIGGIAAFVLILAVIFFLFHGDNNDIRNNTLRLAREASFHSPDKSGAQTEMI